MELTSTAELYTVFRKYNKVSTDSRKISKGCVYFALKGENFNGNKYAREALEKGAAKAVVDEKKYAREKDFLYVDDGLKALQNLAKYHRKKLKTTIVGITGSNGKTTTKELIAAVLKQKYDCFATRGNLNNHIGVPLSILSLNEKHQYAIIEMGANHQGEIDFLCSISQPNFGLITNIGKAHLEGFGGIEGVKKGKSELYRYIKKNDGEIFINGDDPVLLDLAEGIEQYTYGKSGMNNCEGKLIQTHPNIKANWENENRKGKIDANLYGEYNFMNIMAAICIGNHFNVSPTQIDFAINNYESIENRSQFFDKENHKIYLDAYNANPSSMKLAIENFSKNSGEEKWLILGDMFEVGSSSKEEHRSIIELIEQLNIKHCVFVGSHFNELASRFDSFTFFKNTADAVKWFNDFDKSNKQFLIKGSRGVGLEKLLN